MAGHVHPVTDAKYWDLKIKNGRIDLWSVTVIDTGRSSRQNQPFGLQLFNSISSQIVSYQLTEDVLITYTSSNELSGLAAEVHDQDQFVLTI